MDARRTRKLTSNSSDKVSQRPYSVDADSYGVTAGVTFTFGGLKTTTSAEVEDTSGLLIPGLYAAGEILGGG